MPDKLSWRALLALVLGGIIAGFAWQIGAKVADRAWKG